MSLCCYVIEWWSVFWIHRLSPSDWHQPSCCSTIIYTFDGWIETTAVWYYEHVVKDDYDGSHDVVFLQWQQQINSTIDIFLLWFYKKNRPLIISKLIMRKKNIFFFPSLEMFFFFKVFSAWFLLFWPFQCLWYFCLHTETVIDDWLHMRSMSYAWDVSMLQLVNVGARKPQLYAQSTECIASMKPGLDGRANHCTAQLKWQRIVNTCREWRTWWAFIVRGEVWWNFFLSLFQSHTVFTLTPTHRSVYARLCVSERAITAQSLVSVSGQAFKLTS